MPAEKVEKDQIQVVFFTATWCEPCHRMKKTVMSHKDVKAELKKFNKNKVKKDDEPFYIDVDKQQEYTEKYDVDVMPTILLINSKDGTVISRQRGFTKVKDLIAFLRK